MRGRNVLAHRFSWRLENGEIPIGTGYHGTCVLHKCDNKTCVNPAHLELGTNHDNVRDRDKKQRQAVGERNGFSRLSNREASEIACSKESANVLATRYGVASRTIRDLKSGTTWSHLARQKEESK